jgi:hypothetical protein
VAETNGRCVSLGGICCGGTWVVAVKYRMRRWRNGTEWKCPAVTVCAMSQGNSCDVVAKLPSWCGPPAQSCLPVALLVSQPGRDMAWFESGCCSATFKLKPADQFIASKNQTQPGLVICKITRERLEKTAASHETTAPDRGNLRV